MPASFYSLSRAYRVVDSIPQWILNVPYWLESDFDLKAGRRLAERWNAKTFVFAETSPQGEFTKPDFPSVVGEWDAASNALAEAMDELAAGCVEFLPFRTRTSTGGDVTVGYQFMNFLHWVDAVDQEHSKLIDGETEYKRPVAINGDFYLKRVVLNRKSLVHPVCRVFGWSQYRVFRDDIVKSLLERKFTGLDFQPIETV
jgi:hypothetical protein